MEVAEVVLWILGITGGIAFLLAAGIKIDLWLLSRKDYKQEFDKRRKEIDYLNLENREKELRIKELERKIKHHL